MKKSLAAWIILLIAAFGCNFFQPQKEIPPLVFPDHASSSAPTLALLPPTDTPQVVTATPFMPSPIPSTVSLRKQTRLAQAKAYDAFWVSDGARFGIVSPQELAVYKTSTISKLWSAAPGGRESLFQATSPSTNGNFIINFNVGPALHIFDTDNGELTDKKRVLENCPSEGLLKSVYLSNGMKQMFTASQGQHASAPVQIYRWGLSPYGCELVDTVKGESFASLLLSPDEKYLVLSTSAGITGHIIAWDVNTGDQVCSLDGAAAAFHRDGRLAAADMQNNALVYWRLDSCQVSSQLAWVGFPEKQEMAFTPDGKYLLTYRQGLQVWDSKTAALLFEQLIPESSGGGVLRISPDGKTVITITNPGESNTTIDLWAIGDK